ncbi:hypothetical protein [Micromonospora costi]|uniref:hypothetical protein n=1 Tax=Micromonospora costi TaxID=1530042 RepID=UPI00165225CF|nr:hypothetical protein [Micromonospora costi]
MDGNVLVSALIVGLAIGTAGRLLVPGRAAVPVWLTLALGVAAALLGSIVVRLAGVDLGGLTALRLTVQTGCAGLAVVLAVVSGAQRSADGATGRDPGATGHPTLARRPAPRPRAGTDREDRR